LRIPISFKLIAVTTALILLTVAPIAFQNSRLFESTFGKSQTDANAELALSKASEVETLIFNYIEHTKMHVEALISKNRVENSVLEDSLPQNFNADFVNIDIFELKNGLPSLVASASNVNFLLAQNLTKTYLSRLNKERPIDIKEQFISSDVVMIENRSMDEAVPLFSIRLSFPDESNVIRYAAVADIRLERLQKVFATKGVRTTFLVDRNGVALAHSDDSQALSRTSFASLPIVAEALQTGSIGNRGQKRFFDPLLKDWYVGAYSRTSLGPIVVVQAPEKIILEPAKLVRQSSYTIAGYVLSGALFLVFLFSLSLTHPIERLYLVTRRVAQGDFDTKAIIRANDEVGDLAKSFNSMIDGLKERDKIKNIFNKFHGSSVTEDLMKSDLGLGGSNRDVVVFFSDIRGFTKFSEGRTPEEVVEMLNEYFQIMVKIITDNSGIVDKFVGDAIMAIWGAPKSTGDDPYFAVKACLEMRVALDELNTHRIARGQSAILIGMGLHAGPAISGTIGSTERMEYTVIGDTVNMASRIESATKSFGTDFLVGDSIVQLTKDRFQFTLAGEAAVKGKTEPLKMFKVDGMIVDGSLQPVVTPYSSYTAEDSEKIHVA
jgi:adenylate cyclase